MADGTTTGGGGGTIATVAADEVEWTCEHDDGTREACFETGPAVAAMLARGVLFVNAPWNRDELPEADRAAARLLVNCNDVFAWGASDAEPLPMADIPRLYAAWRIDGDWGPAAWCCARRGTRPQDPVAARMARLGHWDPDRLATEGPAYLDARIAALRSPAS